MESSSASDPSQVSASPDGAPRPEAIPEAPPPPAAVPEAAPVSNRKTPDERKELLARTVANQVASGARVESQSDYQAVLVKGKKVNHVLHLILTLVTLGLWAIVWIVLAITGGEKRSMATVDEYGNVAVQKI